MTIKWRKRYGARLVLSLGLKMPTNQAGNICAISGCRPAMVITKANIRYATLKTRSPRERINDIDAAAPPAASHAPDTYRSCQANGLKYHVPVG